MTPRVSVLTTIYNPGALLKPALDSLCAQTFKAFELVVVENGSTDGAKEITRRYAGQDDRIRLIDLPENIGRTPALNLALDKARGEYVAVLDADDIAMPDRIARQFEFLDAHPRAVLVGAQARQIDFQGVVVGLYTPPSDPAAIYDALAYTNPFVHSACMFRRDVVRAVGGYPADYALFQDLALWIILARHGEFGMIAAPLVDLRVHAAQTTVAPIYGFRRHREAISLYRLAQRLPGLSARARRLGSANLATLHFVFARDLWRAGRFLVAVWQLLRMVAADPVYCSRRAGVHLVRRFPKNADEEEIPLQRQ